MNNKININPSSTKWLEKDDRVVADYFCDLGFRSLKQILDMRVFDLMNMQGLNAVRVEEVIICLYKWLNPNTAIDEAIVKDRNMFPIVHHPVIGDMHVNGDAVKLMETKPRITKPAPTLGEDNVSVYGEFAGLSEEIVKEYKEKGIV